MTLRVSDWSQGDSICNSCDVFTHTNCIRAITTVSKNVLASILKYINQLKRRLACTIAGASFQIT